MSCTHGSETTCSAPACGAAHFAEPTSTLIRAQCLLQHALNTIYERTDPSFSFGDLSRDQLVDATLLISQWWHTVTFRLFPNYVMKTKPSGDAAPRFYVSTFMTRSCHYMPVTNI